MLALGTMQGMKRKKYVAFGPSPTAHGMSKDELRKIADAALQQPVEIKKIACDPSKKPEIARQAKWRPVAVKESAVREAWSPNFHLPKEHT